MGMPGWAAVLAAPYAVDKVVIDPIKSIFALGQDIRKNQNDANDQAVGVQMLQDLQNNPNAPIDLSKFASYKNAEEFYNKARPLKTELQTQQAEPFLQRFKADYRNAVGTGDFTDPESLSVLEQEGVRVPNQSELSNPLIFKGIKSIGQESQNEADAAEIAKGINANTAPPVNALARFLTQGGEKSTNQVKTLADLQKQNNDVRAVQGAQALINASGLANFGDSPELNKLAQAAPYGTTPESFAKLADSLGLIKKLETVETGTGTGDTRQRVFVDPRRGTVGDQIGGSWDPKVANQTVNVGVKAYESELGKLTAKDVMDTRDAAKGARNKLDALNAIEVLAGDLNTGKLTDFGINTAQVGASLGLNLDPNLSAKEASRAIMGRLALEARNPAGGAGMPGAMSDADRNFLVSTITPSLGQSKDGRKLLIGTMRQLEQRKIDVADMQERYIQKYGKLDNSFYQQLSQWSQKNPMFRKGKR